MGEKRVRSATINRDTNETKIQLSLNLDGGILESAGDSAGATKSHAAQSSASQDIDVDSGIGFLDHMLHALAKHAGWSLRLRCRGDLHIDDHHTAEDSCIALGQVRLRCFCLHLTHSSCHITFSSRAVADSLARRPSNPPSAPPPASRASAMPTAPSTKRCRAPWSICQTGRLAW